MSFQKKLRKLGRDPAAFFTDMVTNRFPHLKKPEPADALFIRVPMEPSIVAASGGYASTMNVMRPGDTHVQRVLRNEGLAGYEPHTQVALYAICEVLLDDIVMYDIGAHVGLYSGLVDTIFKWRSPKCLAIEPTPSTSLIARNIRNSNKLDFEVLEIALSDKVGTTELWLSPKAETSNSLNSKYRKGAKPIQVEVSTLDELVAGGAPPPTLLKIDVETYESHVLNGGMATIKKHRPWIVCEFLGTRNKEAVLFSLKWLEAEGYTFFVATEELPMKQFSAEELQANTDTSEFMDWILAPSPLPPEYGDAVQRWAAAVEGCGKSTNTPWPQGTPEPSFESYRP